MGVLPTNSTEQRWGRKVHQCFQSSFSGALHFNQSGGIHLESLFSPSHSPSPTWEGGSSGRLPKGSLRDQPVGLGLPSSGCSCRIAGSSPLAEWLLGTQHRDPATVTGDGHPNLVLPPLLLPGDKLQVHRNTSISCLCLMEPDH